MDIVEVRFIKDTQSAHTGHEFYPVGAMAHFYANHAGVLVEQGRAVLKETPSEEAPAPDYHSMTVKQLREEAKASGISVYKMRKADLIAALEGSYEKV